MTTTITTHKEVIDGEEVYILDNTMKSGMEQILKMPESGSYVLAMLKKC